MSKKRILISDNSKDFVQLSFQFFRIRRILKLSKLRMTEIKIEND
jgi:hypothetical protein